MNDTIDSGASIGNITLPHDANANANANASDDETNIAALEARISAALASASDAAPAAYRVEARSPADVGARLLELDRRHRVERFADQQLGSLTNVCRRIMAGDPPPAEHLHQQFMRSFAQAKADGYPADWESTAYPLAVTIDECLLDLSWPGQRWWEDHVLESTLFGTRVGSQRFFEMANHLKTQRNHPAGPALLRVYHECVSLGFRGLYATATPAALAEPLGLPTTLSQWRIELHRAMWQWTHETTRVTRPDENQRRHISGASPLRYQRATWFLGAASILLLAINAIIWSGMGR